MSLVLIVDDMAVIRELLNATLRNAGYETVCAVDGHEALAAVKARVPDLILLDVTMPAMSGIAVLEALRGSPATAKIPVIMLTGSGEKQHVINAAKWGVHDYVLKSQFALRELLLRVRKYCAGPARSEPIDQTVPPSPTLQPPQAETVSVKPVEIKPIERQSPQALPEPHSQRLTREQTLERIERYTESKTLAGVVAEIIALTNSPRTGLAELVDLIKRDALMCARVIQVANTAAFATNKPRVSTIEDAVRNVGLSNVRHIATSVGFFDTFPPDAADGFNLIRCWQHSFAVAAIMDRLLAGSPAIQPGVAHLVGLCHDLGEIVLRQCFGEMYADVVDASAQSTTPLDQLIARTFGMARHELCERVLSSLGLPPTITAPICEHAEPLQIRGTPSILAQALKIADAYAHGLMLASSPHAAVAPITVADFRSVSATPLQIDGESLRSEVLSNTSLLARLSREDESRLARPYFPRRNVKIYYARHPGFSAFDPLETAINSLSSAVAKQQMPGNASELEAFDAVMVAASRPGINPFPLDFVATITQRPNRPLPVVYLCGNLEPAASPVAGHVRLMSYPMTLAQMNQLIDAMRTDLRRAA